MAFLSLINFNWYLDRIYALWLVSPVILNNTNQFLFYYASLKLVLEILSQSQASCDIPWKRLWNKLEWRYEFLLFNFAVLNYIWIFSILNQYPGLVCKWSELLDFDSYLWVETKFILDNAYLTDRKAWIGLINLKILYSLMII